MPSRFRDRRHAGEVLAGRLAAYAGREDVVVSALPRGGVPVGFEIARALHVPLDVIVVRKIGAPDHPELAMGAVTADGAYVVDREVVTDLHISDEVFDRALHVSLAQAKASESLYRAARPQIAVSGRTVIIVDDGMATGCTMRAAAADARKRGARDVVVAVPVAPPHAASCSAGLAGAVIFVIAPSPFVAVGAHYDDFTQTSDAHVLTLLASCGGLAG